jgi:WD40 repeat protein
MPLVFESDESDTPNIDLDCDSNGGFDSLFLYDSIVSLCVLSSSKVIVGCCDNNAYVIDVADDFSLNISELLEGHDDTVTCIKLSTDRRFVATSGYDGRIFFRDSSTLAVVSSWEGASEIELISWDSNSSSLVAGCSDGTMWILGMSEEGIPTYSQILIGHTDEVTCLVHIQDSASFVSGSLDGFVICWSDNKPLVRLQIGDPILAVTYRTDRSMLVFGTSSGAMALVSVDNFRIVARVKAHLDAIECISFSPGDKFIVSASIDGNIQVRDTSRLSGAPRHNIWSEGQSVTRVSWSPGSDTFFVSTTAEGCIRVYCPYTGTLILELQGGHDAIQTMETIILKNGETGVFLGGDDHQFRLCTLHVVDEDTEMA